MLKLNFDQYFWSWCLVSILRLKFSSFFLSWGLMNFWYDLKAVTFVRALNPLCLMIFFYFALFGLLAGLLVPNCEERIEIFVFKETSQLTRLRSTVKNPQADICDCLFKYLIKTWRKKCFSISLFPFTCLSCSSLGGVLSSSSLAITWSTSSVNLMKDQMECFTEGFYKADIFHLWHVLRLL